MDPNLTPKLPNSSPTVINPALDDVSAAYRMAADFKDKGYDPNLAFDAESFNEEFGQDFRS